MADKEFDHPKYQGLSGKMKKAAAQDSTPRIFAQEFGRTMSRSSLYTSVYVASAVSLLFHGTVGMSEIEQITTVTPEMDTSISYAIDFEGTDYYAYSANDGESGVVLVRDDGGDYRLYDFEASDIKTEDGLATYKLTFNPDSEEVFHQAAKIGQNFAHMYNITQGDVTNVPESSYKIFRFNGISHLTEEDGVINRYASGLEEVSIENEATALPLLYEHHQSQWSEALMKIAAGNYGFDDGEVDENKRELTTVTEEDYSYLIAALSAIGALAAANTLVIGGAAAAGTRRRLRDKREKNGRAPS